MGIMRKITVAFILSAIFVHSSWATTKAWLISSEKATKLNTVTNAIEKDIILNFPLGKIFVDYRNGRLFNLRQVRRYMSEIGIVDIKTLQGIGKLNVAINTDLDQEVVLLFPVTGNNFYLRWLSSEGAAPEIIVYDSSTLKPLKKYKTSPPTSNQLMLSGVGDALYSLVQDNLKVDIFKTSDFTLKSSLDIKATFTLGTEGGFIKYSKDRILLSEVITRDPQLEYFDYIYDLPANTISPKIRTTIKGNDFLIPITKKIAIHERQYVGKFKSMRLETDFQSSGKIHFFDSTSGKEVGLAKINVVQDGKFLGITPAEDKLYFLSYGTGFSNPMLHIVDLKTYFVIQTLPMPEASMTMIFFEE